FSNTSAISLLTVGGPGVAMLAASYATERSLAVTPMLPEFGRYPEAAAVQRREADLVSLAAVSVQKNATHPFGSSTSTTPMAPPAGRHVATNVLYFFSVGFPYRSKAPVTHPRNLSGPLGQVDPLLAVGPVRHAPVRDPRPGDRPQRRVLPEATDYRHRARP